MTRSGRPVRPHVPWRPGHDHDEIPDQAQDRSAARRVHPRFSLNQYTTMAWSLREAVDGCARAGVPAVGLWRDKVAELGLAASAKLARDAGIAVSSLCRGGFFAAPDARARQARLDDNRRAVEEAATLGTTVLTLVCGGLGGRGLADARRMVADGIAELAPYAADHGVRLAVEPMHPMFCADRSVIVTLPQALDLAERFPSRQVGVTVDAYHLWWDPALPAGIARARGRILSFQVCDWLDPLPDPLFGRGLPGDGVIDLRALVTMVEAAGYRGPIEVEVFNRALWETPGGEVLDRAIASFHAHVAEHIAAA
jgi:sugar phosphate isomerase/epimerase